MDLKIESKQIKPSVVNLRQFSSTDTLTFVMDSYEYESHDLSMMDCYAVCDMGGKVDKVKLSTEIVDGKLKITWKVTGYTTQIDGHINYLISFEKDSSIWHSYQAVVLVNSSIDPDGQIAADYPSILQQWEERMNAIDNKVALDLETISKAVETTTTNASLSQTNADTAVRASENASKSLSNIQELLGYEPVEAIDMEVMQARGEYDLLGLRLDALEASINSGQVTINRETFIAKQNQHTFVLTKGSYTLGGNYLSVAVNGIQQPAEAIVEIDENTFGLQENFVVDEGDIIDVIYYLLSVSPNMETPDGAQKKVNALKEWTENELNGMYTKQQSDSRYEKKPIVFNTTLLASSWGSNNRITIKHESITTGTVQHISIANNSTLAQLEAFNNAMMIGNGQTNGSFSLLAMGDKPTMNIPVTIVIEGV